MARGEADLPGPGGGARRPGSGDGVLYAEGFFAGGDGASRAANPYPPESNAGVAWWLGGAGGRRASARGELGLSKKSASF